MDKQPLLHASLLLLPPWGKEHNETRPSLGVLTTLWGDYDYPAVAMPTVMSFLYHSIWVDCFFFFLFSKGHPPIQFLGAHWELQPLSCLDPGKSHCLGTSEGSIVLMGAGKSSQQLPGRRKAPLPRWSIYFYVQAEQSRAWILPSPLRKANRTGTCGEVLSASLNK